MSCRRAVATALAVASALGLAASGCADNGPSMRLYSSSPAGATWSLVVEDRARAGQLLIDGRPRFGGCDRAGVMLRCELRGMFPGGHTVELRLAGRVLRRSAVLGGGVPERAILVRARDLATVAGAAHAAADGVAIPEGLEPLAFEELVEAAHKAGIRAFIEAAPAHPDDATISAAIERYALDGAVGATIAPGVARRFPQAKAMQIDRDGSSLFASHRANPLPLATLVKGTGLLDTQGALQLSLAMAAGRAAITDGGGFALMSLRRRHKALREGTATALVDDGLRRAIRMAAGGDAVTLVQNAGAEAWTPTIELPPVPIDLLGGPMSPTGPTVPPGDVAAILASPDPDRTRY